MILLIGLHSPLLGHLLLCQPFLRSSAFCYAHESVSSEATTVGVLKSSQVSCWWCVVGMSLLPLKETGRYRLISLLSCTGKVSCNRSLDSLLNLFDA